MKNIKEKNTSVPVSKQAVTQIVVRGALDINLALLSMNSTITYLTGQFTRLAMQLDRARKSEAGRGIDSLEVLRNKMIDVEANLNRLGGDLHQASTVVYNTRALQMKDGDNIQRLFTEAGQGMNKLREILKVILSNNPRAGYDNEEMLDLIFDTLTYMRLHKDTLISIFEVFNGFISHIPNRELSSKLKLSLAGFNWINKIELVVAREAILIPNLNIKLRKGEAIEIRTA